MYITELESEKWGPALRNRLEGEAAVYKRLLDREEFSQITLRPHFVKGAQDSLPISTTEIHEEQGEIQTRSQIGASAQQQAALAADDQHQVKPWTLYMMRL